MLVIERTFYTIAEVRAAKEQHHRSKSLPASTRFDQHSLSPVERNKEEDETWESYNDVGMIAECQDMEAESQQTQLLTTVVVRNVPRWYALMDLVTELQKMGFEDSVDFINLREDKKRGRNRGHAFVNFDTHGIAVRFFQTLRGHVWSEKGLETSSKSVEVAVGSWAYVQGFKANIALGDVAAPKKVRRRWFLPFASKAKQGSVGSSHRYVFL